jgi:hypothetical protein
MTSQLALLSMAIASCFAQTNMGTISGIITDAQGGLVSGSDVIAVDNATGLRTATKTNSSGFYSISNLPIGFYALTVEKYGFRRYVRTGILLTTSQVLELNAALELGAINETVTVTAAAPPIETRTSDVSQLIGSRSIEDLPLGNRRIMNIVQMTSAAVYVPNDANNARPTYALAGGRLQSQMVWIDGGTGQNIRIGIGYQPVDPPVDVIQEIKLLANNYAAEYGASAGGVVIETTKSGTNDLHGSAYEYLRNDAMDAPGFFAPVQNGVKLPPELRYNVFGGTAGGPIRRNKTFFFAAYEGTRRRDGGVTTLTVPAELQRVGDFSKTFDTNGGLVPIYDPQASPGQPFPDNAIPKDRLDPVALHVIDYFPLPNRPADTIAGADNFRSNSVTALTSDFLIAKIDHSFTDADKFTGRYMTYRSNTDTTSVYPDAGADPAGYGYGHSQYAYGSWTHILNSAKVNDLRYTYVNRMSHTLTHGVGGNYPRKIGLTGVDQNAFPQFSPAGFDSIGSPSQESRQYPIEQHQFVDNLTWLKNRHALKFGFEARYSRNYQVDLSTASGTFGFISRSTGSLDNGGNGLASLLLGLPWSFGETRTQPLDRHSWYFSGFAQDDWSITKNLTLNLGVRWELDTPLMDANRRMNGFDPSAMNPVSGTKGVVKFAGVDGYPEHPYQFDWNNFGPRFGFAWRPFGAQNTVLRGGYGIFYAHPVDSGQPTAANLGFSVSALLVSPDNGITPAFVLRDGVPVTATSPVLDDGFGAVPAGQTPTTAVSYFEHNRVSGYAQQFNFTLQRQLSESIAVEAAFLGNLGRKLAGSNLSIDQIPPQILGPDHHSQADRPFPQFSTVVLIAPSMGVTNYYAGLFKIERRLSAGLNVVSSYTWSKFLGNTNDSANPGAGSLGAENGAYSNYYNRRADYGPEENDIEHRFTLSSDYELPFGKGRYWLRNGFPGYLLGGWSIGVLTTLQSGAPLTAVAQKDSSSAFVPPNRQRPNVMRNPNLPPSGRCLTRWFDTDAFSQPALYTFGDEGVGIMRDAGIVNADFSVMRNLALRERVRLQLRVEFFNAFNHTNFNPPGTIFGSASFGVVSSAKSARQIQVGMRLTF